MRRAQLLRQLVLDSRYVIDEHLVATAMLARAAVRRAVAGVTFRNEATRSSRARALPLPDAAPPPIGPV
jgi:hypothetical protein